MIQAQRSVVAVDVGGTTIKAARVRSDGSVVTETTLPTPVAAGADAVVNAVRTMVRAATDEGGDSVAAIGLAVPGDVDSAAGVGRFSANLGWRDVPLRDLVANDTGLPTVLEHDVRAAALAERTIGASRGVDDCVLVVIGTGIASVAITGGRPLLGARALAGEIGHLCVQPDGEQCPCGQRGCLERYASAAAVARHYRAATGMGLDAQEVCARRGDDPAAAAVWLGAVDALATALAAATMLLDPALFVLAGGLSTAGAALADPVGQRLGELVRFRAAPPVVLSPLGAAAGRTGAALLAWQTVGGIDEAAWRPDLT